MKLNWLKKNSNIFINVNYNTNYYEYHQFQCSYKLKAIVRFRLLKNIPHK